MWLQVLLVAATVGAAAGMIQLGLRPRSLFVVRVRSGGVSVRGSVPGHSPADVRAFFGALPLPKGALVRALPSGPRFELQFSNGIPPGERQRIRNFLYLHL